ncbi:MAG: NAD(P)H-binding protein [Myxococcales bacterium]|nr:NAD(P)H-binding protein [Myxococcales bacterium]
MSEPALLVTGASGHLGRRVLEILLDVPGERTLIAATRTPARLADLAARGVDVRAADFDDAAGLDAAFAGVGRALLISTDAVDPPGRRAAQHAAAVRALGQAGAQHVVYTSAVDAPTAGDVTADHRATETALQASDLDFTVLRNNLYAELVLGALPAAVATGELVDARGDGAVAWISRDDCARVAAAMLLEAGLGRRLVQVAGPVAYTSRDVAALIAEVSGRPVAHRAVTLDERVAGLIAVGVPAPAARTYAAFDAAIAAGELARTSTAVERLTGTPARPLREVLAAHLPPA